MILLNRLLTRYLHITLNKKKLNYNDLWIAKNNRLTAAKHMKEMRMLSESLDRLALLHPKLIDLGLERTFELLEKAGNPHKNLPPIFHIAGTNGKGSVCAYLFSVAKQLGLKTHCYTSPHLCRFNERIRIANNLIDDEELLRVLDEVEKLNQSKPITFYEITTVAAFMAFARIPADLLIL